ncbi:MAG: hypothetical protein ACR2PZ_26535 [Pseudomonadales bacterium]
MTASISRCIPPWYWLLLGYVVATALLKLLSHSIFGTNELRALALYGLYSWILIIPLALLLLGTTGRQAQRARSWIERIGRGLVSALLAVSWLYALMLGLWSMMINESWPLSLRHGPDTAYARDGFNRLVGIPAPHSVTNIYYKSLGVMELHDDLRFRVTDPAVVMHMVNRLELVDSELMVADYNPMFGSLCLTQKSQQPWLKCYYRRNGRAYWYIRYDPRAQSLQYEMISP